MPLKLYISTSIEPTERLVERLTMKGYEVVHPSDNMTVREKVNLLLDCQVLYLREDWALNRMAKVEWALAEALDYILIKE